MRTCLSIPGLYITLLLSQAHLSGALGQGRVVGWGDNTSGASTGNPTQYSPSTSATSSTTVTIAGHPLNDVVAVAAGMAHSLALKADGTVAAWGFNFYGQATGTPSRSPDKSSGLVVLGGKMLTNVAAIAAGQYHNLALQRDGTVIAWGKVDRSTTVTGAVAIAAGARLDSALVLKNDGTVVRLTDPANCLTGFSNIVAIAAGGGDTWPPLALHRNGTVVVLQANAIYEDAGPPVGLTNVTAIAAGYNHYLALKHDGTVFGWGFNGSGQATGAPTTTGRYTAAGSVVLAGQTLSNVTAIAASDEFSLALKCDGKVVGWGRNHFHQTDIPATLQDVIAIAAGQSFCLAITTNKAPVPQK